MKHSNCTLVINYSSDFTGGVRVESPLSVTGTVTAYNVVSGEITVKGSSAEGGQINLGYKGDAITTQGTSSWVINVDGSNSFRVFMIGSTVLVTTFLWAETTGMPNVNSMTAHGTAFFNNATSNLLQFRNTPANPPTYTTRSVGTKILYTPVLVRLLLIMPLALPIQLSGTVTQDSAIITSGITVPSLR